MMLPLVGLLWHRHEVGVEAVDFCDSRGRVHHHDVRFAAMAPPGSVPEVSHESSDVRWFGVDDLPTDEPDMLDLISLAADRLRRS